MSIWSNISKLIATIAKKGEQLNNIFQKLKTPPQKTVGFTIAVIALSAKMAKADGIVTNEEIRAFRQVFFIPKNEEKNASMVFNLARKGFLVLQAGFLYLGLLDLLFFSLL